MWIVPAIIRPSVSPVLVPVPAAHVNELDRCYPVRGSWHHAPHAELTFHLLASLAAVADPPRESSEQSIGAAAFCNRNRVCFSGLYREGVHLGLAVQSCQSARTHPIDRVLRPVDDFEIHDIGRHIGVAR